VKHIVSFSGGKDSTAMLLMMLEKGMQVDEVVFADTQMEFPEMYEYIDKIEQVTGIAVTRTVPNHTWDEFFYGTYVRGKSEGKVRGFPFTAGMGCWARRELKLTPMKKAMGKGNVIYIGIAADEVGRTHRTTYAENINDYKFPLIEFNMTERDCIDYLKDRDLLNPLYERFDRLGCWCCPKQSLKSLLNLYHFYPDLWRQLLKYQDTSPITFKPDYSAYYFDSLFSQPTMF
jgi:3'-phosphoadenosine 5'-phosphosulfate sulfotransferase (PAPS reductase)/FAD synthetase